MTDDDKSHVLKVADELDIASTTVLSILADFERILERVNDSVTVPADLTDGLIQAIRLSMDMNHAVVTPMLRDLARGTFS